MHARKSSVFDQQTDWSLGWASGIARLFSNEVANNCNVLIVDYIEDGSRRIVKYIIINYNILMLYKSVTIGYYIYYVINELNSWHLTPRLVLRLGRLSYRPGPPAATPTVQYTKALSHSHLSHTASTVVSTWSSKIFVCSDSAVRQSLCLTSRLE